MRHASGVVRGKHALDQERVYVFVFLVSKSCLTFRKVLAGNEPERDRAALRGHAQDECAVAKEIGGPESSARCRPVRGPASPRWEDSRFQVSGWKGARRRYRSDARCLVP
jgi:hypothetical protein